MGSLGGMSPTGSIALGIIVGLISTSVQSLGLTLQRKSHILEDEKGPHDVRRPPHRRRRWQLGMGMFIISNLLGSTVQISTLPLPVLSTLQASGLVFNSICATLILGEPFTRWSLWGTLLVCIGAILIAIFGAIPSPTHSLDELLKLMGRQAFLLWMALQAVLVISICVAVDCANHFLHLSQSPRFRFIRGLAFGCVSGILSAHSLLMAKSAVELLIKTLVDGKNQFVHWQAWVIVLALITLALTQLYYLHRGLKLVSTSVLYPLIFCIYNIIAILDGLIYFDQTEFISPLRGCLITLGTVILLSGVLALSWRLSDEQHTPGVGQSSLAPGLGMVEDTDGEEEEEELLLSSNRDEENAPTAGYKYNTFDGREGNNTTRRNRPDPLLLGRPSTISRRKTSFAQPWAERREIWGELDDENVPYSPKPMTGRLRSKTLPINDSSLLISHQRRSLGSPFTPTGVSGSGDRPPRSANSDFVRLRRKSTGFPGFTARRTVRRKSIGGAGIQGAVGGISRWWRSRTASTNNSAAINNNASGEPSPHPPFPEYHDEGDVAAISPALERYRDDPLSASRPDSPPERDDFITGKKRRDDSAV